MASSLQIAPHQSVYKADSIQFGKGHGFYQRALNNSYLDYLMGGGSFTRFSLNGKVYEFRDADANDISNVALRDDKMESLIIGDESLVKKLVAAAGQPNIPIGFYLARESQERPKILEQFYHYVSPEYRKQGIGSVQSADLLLLALQLADFDRILSIKRQRSNFYQGIDGIFSAVEKSGFWHHEIDLFNREEARTIIVKRLKELGIEPIEL